MPSALCFWLRENVPDGCQSRKNRPVPLRAVRAVGSRTATSRRLTRRAEEIAARHYDIPGSKRTSVCVDTLLDWVLRNRSGGFEALAPKPRQDRGKSRTIAPQLADLIERLKRENPHRTGTTLLRE